MGVLWITYVFTAFLASILRSSGPLCFGAWVHWDGNFSPLGRTLQTSTDYSSLPTSIPIILYPTIPAWLNSKNRLSATSRLACINVFGHHSPLLVLIAQGMAGQRNGKVGGSGWRAILGFFSPVLLDSPGVVNLHRRCPWLWHAYSDVA